MIALIVLGASILGNAAAFLGVPARRRRLRRRARPLAVHADRWR
jgi:hypothetical protein